ncbi:MAG: B12-binding domain-containing radical SAM protein [Candidatus Omnitrophica bacterium]|nr:B12-binding domain-containing radical SAM protein [Candidatus Omnitrophota bacterium]
MKIVLVHPQNYLHSCKTGIYKYVGGYNPLTMPTLASLVPADINAEVRIINEMVEEADTSLDADLVGITAIAGTAYRAYEIADEFRRRGIPVVFGGIHATLMQQEVSFHADSVVTGFAEQSWPELLRDFINGGLKKTYYQRHDYVFANNLVPKKDSVKTNPYMVADTMELTRGCPHSCEFCILRGFMKGKYYKKPLREAFEEAKSLNGKCVFFLDANLIGDREYAKEFFSKIVVLKKWWAGCVTSDVAEDEALLKIMAESGCKGVLMGFETLCQDVLAGIGKSFNRVRRYKSIVKKLHKYGIAVHACFVFGFDNDTPEVFRNTLSFVEEAKIDFPQYTLYTPFPGTPAYNKLLAQGRILTKKWSLYNGQNCVFEPLLMSPQELEQGIRAVQSKTYRLGSALKRINQSPLWLWPVLLITNLNYQRYTANIPLVRDYCKSPE